MYYKYTSNVKDKSTSSWLQSSKYSRSSQTRPIISGQNDVSWITSVSLIENYVHNN